MIIKILFFMLLAYLCGAIPFGYLIPKIFRGIDIRQHGSGNPGATNVYRTVSKTLGIVTLLLDALKGYIPVFVALNFNPYPNTYLFVLVVSLVTILGHIFTVFLNFKGGKGVATGCGIFLALNSVATIICLLTFAIVLAIFKYVSLASIIAAIVLPLSLYFLNSPIEIVIFAIIIAILVIARHKSNVKRLLNGTENKIFGKKISK